MGVGPGLRLTEVAVAVDAAGPAEHRDVVGVLLAAGAGTRMGRPKALVRDSVGTPWVVLAVDALLDGGCDEVVVVLGADAEAARELVPARPDVRIVVASDWSDGPGASLAAGLRALREGAAACVSLVDLPGLSAGVVRRVLADAPPCAGPGGASDAVQRPAVPSGALRRAVFDGRPGHPVLVGSAHVTALATAVTAEPGERSAAAWLRRAGVRPVPCGDLWDGVDHDVPGPDTA